MRTPTARHELSLSLDPTPTASARARKALRSAYAKQLPPMALLDLQTVVTELVNNSVEHGPGGRPISVVVVLVGDLLRGEVEDGGFPRATLPAIREASAHGRGFGLRIVEALTRQWAVFAGSTTVWFEMLATDGLK